MILPNENHHMVDLETLDTSATAIVLSIGLASFSLEKGITDRADLVLRIDDQEEVGRTRSDATVAWWADQSPEARKVLDDAENCNKDTHETLIMLGDWLGPVPILWGNGAAFDNAILQNLYESFNIEPPWKHWHNRCYRTLKDLGEKKIARLRGEYIIEPEPSRRGTHHNAMDDATYQAECALRYLRTLAL